MIDQAIKGIDAFDRILHISDNHNLFVVAGVLVLIIFIILVGIFLFSWYKNVKASIEANELILKNTMETNSQLVETITKMRTETLSAASFRKIDEDQLMNFFFDIRGRIKEISKDIISTINADRIGVYLFHNGVTSTHGIPFIKTSCILEIVNSGVGRMKEHTGIQINMIDDMLEILREDGVFILDSSCYQQYQTTSKLLLRNKKKTSIVVSILNIDNSALLGFLVAEVDEVIDSNELSTYKFRLRKLSTLIGPIMDNRTVIGGDFK